MKEITEASIKQKLSGAFSDFYPIYTKLRDELATYYFNIKFILKTNYIVIDTDKGLLGVVFWKKDGLHVAIPNKVEHNRIVDGKDLKYIGCDKKIVLQSVKDVDSFVLNLFKEMING